MNISLADKGKLIKFALSFIKLFDLIFSIIKEAEILYYLLYGGLAVCGVLIHPLFFVFHLSEVFIRYPSL